jgi:hypothetical protein
VRSRRDAAAITGTQLADEIRQAFRILEDGCRPPA